MKIQHYFVIFFLTLTSCNSDRISEKSIELNNKAVNAMLEEKYSEALNYAEEAIKEEPNNYTVYTVKTQALIKEGKLNEAEKTVQKQLKIKPDFAEGWTIKGMINDLNGNPIKAKSDYQKGITLFEQRIKKGKSNKQANIINEYFNLILIGDEVSKQKMTEIENQYKNDKSVYDLLISYRGYSKEEIMKQLFSK